MSPAKPGSNAVQEFMLAGELRELVLARREPVLKGEVEPTP